MEPKVSRSTNWTSVLPAIVIPICIGMSMYLGLSALIERGVIADETLLRYLTGHPISHVTVAMFFVGIGSLLMIGWNVATQFRSLESIDLQIDNDQPGVDSQDASSLVPLETKLLDHPPAYRQHYLWRRLHDALQFIRRTDSTTGFEDELKYLSDVDSERQQQRYSLVRILIWATPMLGFLGTVLGISQALGGIQVGPENDFSQMMGSLRASLYVAFDTTALALALSMVLMFAQFFVDRFETQLLFAVDHGARDQIAQHVKIESNDRDRTEEIKQAMLETAGDLVEKQAELWRKSIEAAEKAWVESLTGVSQQVRDNLTESLDHSVHCLSDYLGQAIRRADVSMSHRWHQWQVSLSENVRTLREYYAELTKQTGLISELLKSTGGDPKLSEALLRSEEALDATESLTHTLDQMIESIEETADEPQHDLTLVSQDEMEQESLPQAGAEDESNDITGGAQVEHAKHVEFDKDCEHEAATLTDNTDTADDLTAEETLVGALNADQTNLDGEPERSQQVTGPWVKTRVNWDYFRQPVVLSNSGSEIRTDSTPKIFKFKATNSEVAEHSEKKAA